MCQGSTKKTKKGHPGDFPDTKCYLSGMLGWSCSGGRGSLKGKLILHCSRMLSPPLPAPRMCVFVLCVCLPVCLSLTLSESLAGICNLHLVSKEKKKKKVTTVLYLSRQWTWGQRTLKSSTGWNSCINTKHRNLAILPKPEDSSEVQWETVSQNTRRRERHQCWLLTCTCVHMCMHPHPQKHRHKQLKFRLDAAQGTFTCAECLSSPSADSVYSPQDNRLQVGCGGGLISDTPKDIQWRTPGRSRGR